MPSKTPLIVAAVAVAPLLAFAFLWASLLAVLGLLYVADLVGFI